MYIYIYTPHIIFNRWCYIVFDKDGIDTIFGLSYTYTICIIDLYCIYNRGCCAYCGWILDVVSQLEYILFKVIAVDAWSCNNSAGRNRNFQKRGRSTSGCIHGLYLRTSQAWMQMHASTWFTFYIWVFSTEAAAQRRLGVSLQEKDIDKEQQQQACSEIWHGHCSRSSSDLCWSQSQIRQRNDDHQKAGPKNAAIRSVQPVLHDSVGNWRIGNTCLQSGLGIQACLGTRWTVSNFCSTPDQFVQGWRLEAIASCTGLVRYSMVFFTVCIFRSSTCEHMWQIPDT